MLLLRFLLFGFGLWIQIPTLPLAGSRGLGSDWRRRSCSSLRAEASLHPRRLWELRKKVTPRAGQLVLESDETVPFGVHVLWVHGGCGPALAAVSVKGGAL